MSTLPTAEQTVIDPLIAIAQNLLEPGEWWRPVTFVGHLTT
jgi:hypothetical protein